MNFFKFLTYTLPLLFSTSAAIASPITMQFDVQANPHVWNGGVGYGGNVGLSTGINFDLGDMFSVAVDNVNDTWNFCTPSASCTVDADGIRPALNTALGTYTNSGFSFNYGTLVGRVSGGDFFNIGTGGFSGSADATGELFLYHWDHNTNNSGSISATVAYSVPEPSMMVLMSLGIFGIGLSRRKLTV